MPNFLPSIQRNAQSILQRYLRDADRPVPSEASSVGVWLSGPTPGFVAEILVCKGEISQV